MTFEKRIIGNATLYRGSSLNILPTLPACDLVITDPPYCSGGMYRADRTASVSDKYEQSDLKNKRGEFSGDAKDQRAFTSWCSQWMEAINLRSGGYFLSFIDWRQIPAITDAIQWSGLLWRGVAAWDKGAGARAPHKGYLKHQAEFIVWATAGKLPPATHAGPFPGVYKHPVLVSDKHHPAGKPTALMLDLCAIAPPDSLILDPFMGSGSTGIAALALGHRFVGCEIDEGHFETACKRLTEAQQQMGLLLEAA